MGHLLAAAAAARDLAEWEALLRVMEDVSSDRDWSEAVGIEPSISLTLTPDGGRR